MGWRRREVLKFALAAPIILRSVGQGFAAEDDLYDFKPFGNARVIHITDTHGQLEPLHFREPSVNIGVASMRGRPPHLVGNAFLKEFEISPGSASAHAFTFLDFENAAKRYGRIGGFAHIKTLVDLLRSSTPSGRSVTLDGGDLWQGSALAHWSEGMAMVDAANLLGVDAMTGHWEFTYGEKTLRKNLATFKGEFVAQNVFLNEEAAFNGAEAFDTDSGRVFKPYFMREMGDYRVAFIGQAFPYVPIAHPKRFVPDWTFGVREEELQKLVSQICSQEKPDAVILLSHNGMDVDLKLASRVNGIDVILGGHTHDAVPHPIVVQNSAGKTLVTNAGSSGKFVAVLDLELAKGHVKDVRYRLLPVFSEKLKADPAMSAVISQYAANYAKGVSEKLAVTNELLYRRGNFNGTVDELICSALRQELDTEIALSPGFRWGGTVPAGEVFTMKDLLSETAMTYPEVYVQPMTGQQLKDIMEDVCDNLFNTDPYYQQGGDMVRLGGISYACTPSESVGKRIGDLKLENGQPIEASKSYRVAGWASVNPQNGKPVWEAVANYMRDKKYIEKSTGSVVQLKGVAGNPGFAG